MDKRKYLLLHGLVASVVAASPALAQDAGNTRAYPAHV